MDNVAERLRIEPIVGAANFSVAACLADGILLHALARASHVQTHWELFQWLQSEVQSFVPHHSLISGWGDFQSGDIGFDVCSRVPGVTTRSLGGAQSMPLALKRLHDRVAEHGSDWCVLRGLHSLVSVCGTELALPLYRCVRSSGTRALLVHRQRCTRAGQDCVYVFALTDPKHEFNPLAVEILLPHIDRALRRIECQPTLGEETKRAVAERVDQLSGREHEVLEWVSQGKSNEEIGAILGISHNTVKNHLKRVFNKMGVTARSQAVHIYMRGRSQSSLQG